MAVDNKQIAENVLAAVGGPSNVTIATNCMTRLRLTLVDNSKADVETIKKIKGVLGAQFSGTQLQVIIGQNVPKVLDEFVAMSGVARGAAVDENLDADRPKEKLTLAGIGNAILDYLSGSMTQILPLIMAGSFFRTVAVLLGPSCLNLLASDSAAYTFLYTTMYEGAFTFLPIVLGYAAAKKIGASPVLGMLAGGILIAPSVLTAADAGETICIYGLELEASDYTSSVLPIVLTIPVLYLIEKAIKKVMPDVLSTVFTPFCTILIVVPIMFFIMGPIGNIVGGGIATIIFGLDEYGLIPQLIAMALLGAFWQLFVVAGMHMPVILIAIVQIAAAGYDPFVFVSTNCAMTAVWGCAFGAFLRLKDKDEKGMALGYVISAIAGGVTEPALFGVILRFRRTMPCMFVGGAIGAVLSGIFGVYYYQAGGGSNFLVWLNYVGGGTMNLVLAIAGMAIAFAISAALVFMFGFSKEELALDEA